VLTETDYVTLAQATDGYPECGNDFMIPDGGCALCPQCGYSPVLCNLGIPTVATIDSDRANVAQERSQSTPNGFRRLEIDVAQIVSYWFYLYIRLS